MGERSYFRDTVGLLSPGLITVVLIVLKLTKIVGLSWLWVLAPLWILPTLALALLTLVVTYVIADVGWSVLCDRR